MTIGSIGKGLATQALESAKNSVMDAVRSPEPSKQAEQKSAAPPLPAQDTASVIVSQIMAMQRPLKEDQELAVLFPAGEEMLRVHEIFVPNADVLVFAGVDPQGNVTRVISPVATAKVICKILKVAPGTTPVRVNVLTPRPQPKPAA